MRLRATLCTAVYLLSLPALGAGAKKAHPGNDRLEFSEISGRGVAAALAETCTDEHWKKFATWAKRTHFTQRTYKQSMQLKFNENGIDILGRGLKSKFNDKGSIEITFKGRKYSGDDPCQLVLAYVDASAKKKSALQLLVPPAYAEVFNEEGKDEAFFNQTLFAGTAATSAAYGGSRWALRRHRGALPADVKVKKGGRLTLLLAGLGTVAGAYGFQKNSKIASTKHTFDDLMSSWTTLQCSDVAMIVKAQTYTATVRKVPAPPTVQIEDGETKKSVVSDAGSVFAMSSRRYLVQMAETCKSQDDAQAVMTQYKQDREAANMRLAGITEAPVGTEGETETPPAEAAPSAQ